MKKIFGIDLGTTYSCIAYINEYDKPQTIKNSEGDITTASVVWFDSSDHQTVGNDAKDYAITDPDNSVAFIKREIGTDFRREIKGVSYSPEEISSKILVKLTNDANETLKEQGVLSMDEKITDVVITCPAYFGMAEKEATRTAGTLAKLNVLDIINEPTAAAINYGAVNGGEKKRVMVYDLGGGTFDITVIDIEGNKIDVVCTGGDPHLGGKDWDEALIAYFARKWQEEKGTDDDITEDIDTYSQLMSQAEKAKKSLTSREKAIVSIIHEGDTMRIELTRPEFDEITKPLLEKTIDLTNDCLKTMETKKPGLVGEILLVGGSSRMPQVKAYLEQKYNIPVSLHDPDEAVAKGAAIYAKNVSQYEVIIEEIARNSGSDADKVKADLSSGKTLNEAAAAAGVDVGDLNLPGRLVINNVSSRTYGIKCINSDSGEVMIANFIKQNDKLPMSEEQTFVTLDENQSGVKLSLFETFGADKEITDKAKVEGLTPVTEFSLTLEKAVPKGTEILVKMTLNNSGLISIYAEDMCTHTKLEAEYQVKNGISDKEKEDAVNRAKHALVE